MSEENTTLPAIESAIPVPAPATSAPAIEVAPVNELPKSDSSPAFPSPLSRSEFVSLASTVAKHDEQIEKWKTVDKDREARVQKLESRAETTTQSLQRVELKTDANTAGLGRLETKQDKQTEMLELLVENMGKIAKSVAGFLDDPKVRNLVLSALGSIVFILGLVATYLAAHNATPPMQAPVPVQVQSPAPPQIVTVLVPTAAPAPSPAPAPKGSQ